MDLHHTRVRAASRAAAMLPALLTDVDASGIVWRGLVRGEYSVVDVFYTDERHYLVFRSSVARARPVLSERVRSVLEGVLLDWNQKTTAFEMGCSVTTVTSIAHEALRSMGFASKPSRVPFLLVLLARLERERLNPPALQLTRFFHGDVLYCVASVPRPEALLASTLTPSELSVIGLLVEGHSHSQIATLRGSAARTVSNQLASAYRRLRVSGRAELLRLLVELWIRTPTAMCRVLLPVPA
jgi:DNA-binding CsgD family transcriptional regulator